MSLNAYANIKLLDRIEFQFKLNNLTGHTNYSYGSVNGDGDILYVQEAARATRCDRLTIVTRDRKETIEEDGYRIEVVGIEEWLTRYIEI